MTREIRFYKKYFIDFYVNQDKKVQEKIEYVLMLIKIVEKVPKKFLQPIKEKKGLYEIRVKQGNNIYRIFCCFDRDNIIILLNAFQKKSQKTPKKEIEKAFKLMQEYFKTKKK